jgi:hypothetical protein
MTGPGGYCSPRHRVSFTRETKAQGAFDDVASAMRQALRGFKVRHMTWRAVSGRVALLRGAGHRGAARSVPALRRGQHAG